ncbi:MAG: Gfo/Idh/MocA family oxidoreductase [Planctomycetota bacterium]|nr:Gfo/Idh/MocA family oxidoreductase [Planctomycetota bacterium]
MNLTPEETEVGRDNYYEAIGVHRRDFLKGVVAAGVTSGAGLGAMYFGYGGSLGDPVRVGVIGTGDEGNVLIGAINPEYVHVKAICDIRPYSVHRAFHGEWNSSPLARAARKGLMAVYGWQTEDEARTNVKVYTDYADLLKDPAIEAIIIALPLHLHAPVAVAALAAGKHVLTEKLMAHNVAQCKDMARAAKKQDLLLATGHQRHYNVLYENAKHLLQWGLLGELHHIRAQWHRGNLPGSDSWKAPLPGGDLRHDGSKYDKIADDLRNRRRLLKEAATPQAILELQKQIAELEKFDSDKQVDAEKHGYQSLQLPSGRDRSALEELVRWRLWNRTGGGLMAELGSHQLDAASIFVSAMRGDGKKVHPLSVHAVGGRHIFPMDREAEDHVYCMFEFPAPGYEVPKGTGQGDSSKDVKRKFGYYDPVFGVPSAEENIPSYKDDSNKRIVVTYSSINGNGFGGYGEVVMGTKGTLILKTEQELMVYKDQDTSSKISVTDDKGGPTMDTQASGAAGAVAKAADYAGPVSRGYAEEIEHWAWCIRHRAPENLPRCTPEVAMGDAIIALTTNVALARSARGEGGYVYFKEEWFDVDNDETPDGSRTTI